MIKWATACVERDAKHYPKDAGLLSRRIALLQTAIELHTALNGPDADYVALLPVMKKLCDTGMDIPIKPYLQIWALYLVHMLLEIAKHTERGGTINAQTILAVVTAFMPSHVLFEGQLCLKSLKLSHMRMPFSTQLETSGKVLVEDIFGNMMEKGELSKDVIFEFSSKTVLAYKRLLIDIDDEDEDEKNPVPSKLTDTMKVCNAMMTALRPLQVQDFESVARMKKDFDNVKDSLLVDLLLKVQNVRREGVYYKTLFVSMWEGGKPMEDAYGKLRRFMEGIDDASPGDDDAEHFEHLKDIFGRVRRDCRSRAAGG